MIAISISMLKKKTGIVIFVGMAARLLINAIAIAPMVIAKYIILFPPRKTANTVIGASIQPWMARMAASHPKRYCSCSWHQLMNLAGIESLTLVDRKV